MCRNKRRSTHFSFLRKTNLNKIPRWSDILIVSLLGGISLKFLSSGILIFSSVLLDVFPVDVYETQKHYLGWWTSGSCKPDHIELSQSVFDFVSYFFPIVFAHWNKANIASQSGWPFSRVSIYKAVFPCFTDDLYRTLFYSAFVWSTRFMTLCSLPVAATLLGQIYFSVL